MKCFALALALFHTAAAFAPSARRAPSRIAPSASLNGWSPDSNEFAYGLPGSLDPVPFFDPAGFCGEKTVDEVKMLREAEVTHGRI